ncbi:MAG: 50S ribosomal protein L33 [Candidatus Latescibacterota bacterium]|jgi:large subunit ribosomal protein L33|nr:50S ribosomal protein L33 [Gemmatimonadota bacterium]MBI93493.1 50S ribosomal protein L33 [Gemmatimonadaceae bacterium]MDP6984925.1 50S ribosomal protein L33 [Candidatus Latescibacterota bacterium]MEC8930585.1 50S ribosomal protein L33 [Candidatus Latescibacterota bacterium]MEC8989877.1 50S ribosomal protein L33 [Candidatus Latescibacterota bacterium]|tara:strand:+ start:486 stop:647 length:162 start_codon:yes stop_codon:yes gene_type:complete
MAKTGPRNQITLKSTESNHCYYSSKNRRNQQGRLEVKKYDPTLRKHVMYREER